MASFFTDRRVNAQLPMENPQECVTNFDPNEDYFPHKAIIEEAEHFTVEYFNHYKIVKNTEDNQTYVLNMCGTPEPDPPIEGAAVIQIPILSAALQYSTMEVFFETLGARRVVQAILGTSFSTASCMQDLVDSGEIVELDDDLASMNASYVDDQGMLETNGNLTMPFSSDSLVGFVGRTPFNGKTYPFPFARISDTLEPTREGMFENVKFYAAFLNLEARANAVWDQVQERLSCVQANAAEIELEQGSQTTILWASYSTYCGAWDVARSGNFFYHDFAEICSADVLSAENGGTTEPTNPFCVSDERKYMSHEEFVAFGKSADVWIYPDPFGAPLDNAEIFTDEVKAFKSFEMKEVYDAAGATGWFDQAFIQPGTLKNSQPQDNVSVFLTRCHCQMS